MLRLRKILLSDIFYIIILLISITQLVVRLSITKKSPYNTETKEVEGYISKITNKDSNITLELNAKEKLIINVDKKYLNKINLNLGDTINVIGEFKEPQSNTTKYLFNYKLYLKRKNINFTVNASSIKIIRKNKKIYYKIKQYILNKLGNNAYLQTFIVGDKSQIKSEIKTSFQENGISHLFAISGMHITLLASIIEKILKKYLKEEDIFKVTSTILIIYLLIVGLSPSILRGVLFYILFMINKIYYFYIKPINIFLFILSISLIINPSYIFDVGFLYSFQISYTLLSMSKELSSNNYFISLLKVSLISFLGSIPISLYNFYQINILSIIYNLIYVPLISIIIFPASLIVFIIKPLEPIYLILTSLLEKTSLFLSQISLTKLSFIRLNIIIYLIYEIIFITYTIIKNKKLIYIFLIILVIHYSYPLIFNNNYVKVIDVGQGDSILIHINNRNILVDTGTSNKEGTLTNNTLVPIIRSSGIQKIDTLIISHGDKDHMGEAEALIDRIKIDQVIFNIGKYNYLEKKLIKKLSQKRIEYYQNVEKYPIKKNILYFLNTKEYDNENDNSNVVYTEINGIKILLMGDAGLDKENDIIKSYALEDIDILKVGHHGSNTSSGEKFIEKINPKTCIISVGKNNRYNHPNKSVLEILNKCNIYRTDEKGTIEIVLKKNNYKIMTS